MVHIPRNLNLTFVQFPRMQWSASDQQEKEPIIITTEMSMRSGGSVFIISNALLHRARQLELSAQPAQTKAQYHSQFYSMILQLDFDKGLRE